VAPVVHKYGGSSVADPERIRAVARRVAGAAGRGERLVVVVSAMGDSTDDLLALAGAVTGGTGAAVRHPREMDMLLSAGERISMALLAMAIREEGHEARSFTGSQAAIITDGTHTDARIHEVRADRVREALDAGQVAIVAGFQGVSAAREITTLGRGGSDTSAVALAAALGAECCEIYTDVDGVFSADPRRVPGARLLAGISHAEMLEMASSGAQVMHPRAIEIASRFGLDLRIRSSFREEGDPRSAGTLVTSTPGRMEKLVLTGLASTSGFAKLTLRGLPAGLATSAVLLEALSEAGVSLDMIGEAAEAGGGIQLQLTLAEPLVERALDIAARSVGGRGEAQRGLSRIALVGSGMTGRPGVYARAFRALLDADAEVHAISTSSISIAVLVPEARERAALRALHDAFALDMAPEAVGG
jgi:aspartate kinase